MADNVEISSGTGVTVAADDVGGVHYQRVKVVHGADGAAADTSSASPFPITLVSGSVTLADNEALTAWLGKIGAGLLIYDGTNMDLVRNVTAVDGAGSTGLIAAGLIGYDANAAVNRRVRVDATGHLLTQSTAWSVSSQPALSNTKTQIKASAGTLGGYMIYNPTAAAIYVQVWDVAIASITVGTTAPAYVLSIPAGSAANLELACGVSHATAINVAATTTPTGGTAPTSAVTCAFFYK